MYSGEGGESNGYIRIEVSTNKYGGGFSMKRIIGWFVDFLMPLILLLSYTLLERVISIKYQYVPVYEKEVPFEIISNFIIALYVILLCKRSFRRVKENSGIHTGSIWGILLVTIVFAISFIPEINFKLLNHFLLYCPAQCTIIFTVVIVTFIAELKRK